MLVRVAIPFLLILRLATTSPTSSEHDGQIGSWEKEIVGPFQPDVLSHSDVGDLDRLRKAT